MTLEENEAELAKYKPLYGKIGNYLAILKKENDELTNDTTAEDAKTEVEAEIVKLEPVAEPIKE